MYWCIIVDNKSHAVLGDYDPEGFSAQRSCDQQLVPGARVVFGRPECAECLAIKGLMAENWWTREPEVEQEEDHVDNGAGDDPAI